MTLSDVKINEKATIINIDADKTLKSRLNSFGITKNTKIEVVALTLGKNTIEIKINRLKIALRISEADKIEVQNDK